MTDQLRNELIDESNNPWDVVARLRYKVFGVEDKGDFSQKHIIDPALEEMMGDVNGRVIAEVGSGTGRFARQLASKGAKVIALDSSQEMLNLAVRTTSQYIQPRYILANVEQCLPLQRESVDLITSVMVLHTVTDVDSSMKQMSRILKPGGHIYIVIPHPVYATVNFRSAENLDPGKYLTPQEGVFVWRDLTNSCEAPTQFIVRSLQSYVKTFRHNGFSIEDINEPAIRQSALDDLDDVRTIEVYNRLTELPNFIIFDLKKDYAEC